MASKHSRRYALVALFAASYVGAINQAQAQPRAINYDEAKIPRYTLPDPLLMSDGTEVTDADTWRTKRRPELLWLFKEHVYGAMPPPKTISRADIHDVQLRELGGKAMCREVSLFFNQDRTGPGILAFPLQTDPVFMRESHPSEARKGFFEDEEDTAHDRSDY